MTRAAQPPSLRYEFRGTERYELRAPRGAGATGVVYEAFDRQRGTLVALKCLPSTNPEAVVRFKNEFRSVQDLHHENLVSLGELVYEGGELFFTMELVDGIDLISYCWYVNREPAERSLLSKRRLACPEDPTIDGEAVLHVLAWGAAQRPLVAPDELCVRSAFAQLVRALLTLHAANKVHRDVKPSNVLVTPSGRVVLLDFGAVADLETLRGPSAKRLIGTVSYMSPEQAARGFVGFESDWYNVGAMLFEVLTGRLPFEGDACDILRRKQFERPPLVRDLAPGAPRRLAELCARLLDPDLAKRPSGEEILQILEFEPGPSIRMSPREPPFVGRTQELLALNQALARARAGLASVVHVEGESGSGKTALIQHFAASAPEIRDSLVLRGRCSELEYVPYRAVDGAIDSLAEFLAGSELPGIRTILGEHMACLTEAFPVFERLPGHAVARSSFESSDPHVRRFRLFRGLRALLGGLRAHRNVVIILDDMQWADADSMALLSAIVRAPDAPAVLFLVASRPHWSGRSVLRAWGAETVRLPNLSYPESVALAGGLLRQAGLEGPRVEQVARTLALEANGHPLFIDELVRQTRDAPELPHGHAILDSVLWSRVARLAPHAQALVKLAAVAGSTLPYRVLARAAAFATSDGLMSVSELAGLRNEHLLQFSGGSSSSDVEIYHDRVGAAVRARLPAQERRELHAAIASALESDPRRDPEELAVHWQGAGLATRAAGHALTAAVRAKEALAFERAARLYQMALECWPDQPRAEQIREELGSALANAGLGAAAAHAYLAASKGVDAPRCFELERRAADQLFRAGHIDEAEPLIQRVLRQMDMSLPNSTFWILVILLLSRVRLALTRFNTSPRDIGPVDEKQIAELDACWSVAVGLSMVSNLRGACLQSRHLLLALRVKRPIPLVRALATEASYVAVRGQPALRRAESLLSRAEVLASGLSDPYAFGFVRLSKAICRFLVGIWEQSRDLARAAERVFETRPAGAMWELASARTFGLWSNFYLGDIAAMRFRISDFIQEAETRGDRYASTLHRTGLVAMIWLASDEPDVARGHLLEAETGWSRSTFDFQRYLMTLGHCLIDLYEGAPELAYRRIVEIWPQLRSSMYLRIQNLRFEALYLRATSAIGAAAAPGGRRALLHEAEQCARRIERERVGWASALSSTLVGGIAELRGDLAAASQHWQAAEAAAETHGMALFAAAAAFRRGALTGGQAGAEFIHTVRSRATLANMSDPDRVCALVAPGIPLHRLNVPRRA